MDATNAIATLKSLLTPGTEVLTTVTGNRATGYVLAFVKDKQNPMALIPLNLLIEKSGLFDPKSFTKDGYKSKTTGMDRAFELVFRLEERLYDGFLPNYGSGDMQLRLRQSHYNMGWFLGGESASKKWLIKSDFDGGQVDAFVVTGSREDAETEALWHANQIAGVNGLYSEDKSQWTFQNYEELIARVGTDGDAECEFWSEHDCPIIYQLSIEEV